MRIKSIPKHIIRLLQGSLKANKYYNWYVFCRRVSQELETKVMKSYSFKCDDVSHSQNGGKKQVVFVCNGNNESGGWADRLKGIISTYQVCKADGYDFRLLFTSPFQLQDFLIPNTYNWQIHPKDVIFQRPHTEVVAFEIGQENDYQSKKQQQLLTSRLRQSNARQIHVYCNAMFAYKADFSGMFNELFRPAPRLASSIALQKVIVGDQYVSVSVRFIGALGDFIDTMKIEPLPVHLQKTLIDRCISAITKIHMQHPDSRILVNSDSTTFLNAVRQLQYVHIIPGEIIHLDVIDEASKPIDTYQQYEKTMLDFFMIANAQCIYRIDGQWIHPSGYPYAASKVYNRPFRTIQTI